MPAWRSSSDDATRAMSRWLASICRSITAARRA
jgi:hypothetical protein